MGTEEGAKDEPVLMELTYRGAWMMHGPEGCAVVSLNIQMFLATFRHGMHEVPACMPLAPTVKATYDSQAYAICLSTLVGVSPWVPAPLHHTTKTVLEVTQMSTGQLTCN